MIGKFLRYPDQTGKRIAEGGVRIHGLSKRSQSNQPLVTVITVCFNAARTLEQCIRSVLGQLYPNIEYVIVDGNSSDDTLSIIQSYADRIDYYVSEPDDGIYCAMNKGLELSQGDYIVFLNSDDWYQPNAIDRLVKTKLAEKCDFVSALANYVDEYGKFIRVQPPSPFDHGVNFRMPLRHETMLIPAWMYNELGGYDTNYRIIADRVFTARLFWRGYSHKLLSEPLLNFRTSGASSVDLDGLFNEREMLLKNYFPGMSIAALRDLVNLERLTLNRLCEISRNYRSPEFREPAIAYALDREAQGDKGWQEIDENAFSPTLHKRSVHNSNAASDRRAKTKKKAPKVSVILPIYNAEDTLHECLDSLLSQTLEDFEIICINDQSPDKSHVILDKYAQRDNRIKRRANEFNVGLGTSRNRGIKLARGEYIFHIDPDDVIPSNALKVLVENAEKYGSEMVRGAFLHGQLLMGKSSNLVRKGLPEGAFPVVNTRLDLQPELLHSTEGHWSYLYRAEFAKRVFYPEDLKMGQDSIFLVHALTSARSITLIPDVIYHYRANSQSAMNVFNFRKYIDEIEWRYRAWKILVREGQRELGEHLLFNYWNIPFFDAFDGGFKAPQKRVFFRKLFYVFKSAGNGSLTKTKNPELRKIFAEKIGHFARVPLPEALPDDIALPKEERLKIDVITTSDHGGAGLASLRCVQGMRMRGHEAKMLSLFTKSDSSYVWRLPVLEQFHNESNDDNALRQTWRRLAVLTHQEQKTLKARELFSKIGNVTDTAVLSTVLQDADILHLHWVSGVIDYDRLPNLIGDKPVVWTLHDMNPFTGGCHYSEGCTEYRNECKDCPLIDGDKDLVHKAWKKKKQAYAKIKNLQVICPSQWLADCAYESSLFGNRQIHTVPNIFPAKEFKLTNKLVARQRLGLPLDRKLIAFGADSLNNSRKGGDLLVSSLQRLMDEKGIEGVEGIFFGAGQLDLCIKTHSMGYIADPEKLSYIYAAADVFAFPSREDNAPQTVLEAMLSGTPVVAFPVGYVPELVKHKHTGYIAKYEDVNDFAAGLAWALENPRSKEALKRGLQVHKVAKSHNNPDVAVDRHIEIFRRMLAT